MNFNFNNYKKCEMFQPEAEKKKEFKEEVLNSDNIDLITENKKELTEEEVLSSNNVSLIVEYAKKNRSKVAIDKVRELLELSRKTGEEVVQNFLSSFKECEKEKIDYLNFENTESGKIALELLEKMPEPFKSRANEKLENYKQELKYNTELFKKHNNDPKKIWKEIIGFDYGEDSSFIERFKAFLFRDSKALSNDYWKNNKLKTNINPFSIEFIIRDADSYNELSSSPNASKTTGGFFTSRFKTGITAINDTQCINISKKEYIETSRHETEHAIHKRTNPIITDKYHSSRLGRRLDKNGNFDSNKILFNKISKEIIYDYLEQAKDEIFAYKKNGEKRRMIKNILLDKTEYGLYDYNQDNRNNNYDIINNNNLLSNNEKLKLKEAVDFMQSEYDRVLNNMIDVIYNGNKSIEFFRNVPTNELWKYSDGEYGRTDFIIREFKF